MMRIKSTDPLMSAVNIALKPKTNIVEADVKNSVKVLNDQLLDIDDSISILIKYRDDCQRGSARRADFASSIRRLKDWRKKLAKKIERASGTLKEHVQINERMIITEGGLGKRVPHLYDDMNITFDDLRSVFLAAANGRLKNVSEKTDGQNIFVTWSINEGRLFGARSVGNIKSGGLDDVALDKKFEGRGTVHEAFVDGFNAIQRAVSVLSPKEKLDVFGPDKNVWFSVEIMHTHNKNVVDFDANRIIFHRAGSAEFDRSSGHPINANVSERHEKLISAVDRMNEEIGPTGWTAMGPPVCTLGKKSPAFIAEILQGLDEVMLSESMQYDDTLRDFIITRISSQLHQFDEQVRHGIACRILDEKHAPTLNQLKVGMSKDECHTLTTIINASKSIKHDALWPIEELVHKFATQLLEGMNSIFVKDNAAALKKMKRDVLLATETIKIQGDKRKLETLNNQMKKLQSVDNITTAMEGIVFWHNDKPYKFTGNFAPANRILGLLKYERKQDQKTLLAMSIKRTIID